MNIRQVVNSKFYSNTYIISEPRFTWFWLIDFGYINGIIINISDTTTFRVSL